MSSLNEPALKAGGKRDLKSSSILIVDDMSFNLLTLEEMLKSAGFVNIETANSGKVAVERIEQQAPDIILTDLIMPEMDGFELCKYVRDHNEYKYIPIIVQTASQDPGQKLKAFNLGATDFINKPVDKSELVARMLVHLEKKKLLSALAAYQKRVSDELECAKEMQLSMMPSEPMLLDIKNKYNVDVQSFFSSSSELGGDFWGIKPVGQDALAFYVVDFSGHGVTAALNTFRMHTLLSSYEEEFKQPNIFLQELNKQLFSLLAVEQYATMSVGLIDLKRNKLLYSGSGAPAPILINNQQQLISLDSSGIPVGMVENSQYSIHEYDFGKDCALIIYSDALIETPDIMDGALLHEEDLYRLISRNLQNAQDTNALFKKIKSKYFNEYAPNQNDDFSLLMLAR